MVIIVDVDQAAARFHDNDFRGTNELALQRKMGMTKDLCASWIHNLADLLFEFWRCHERRAVRQEFGSNDVGDWLVVPLDVFNEFSPRIVRHASTSQWLSRILAVRA